MMIVLIAAISSPVGGTLYRLRGGVLKDWFPKVFGTQLSRLAWALPTAALMTWASGAPWWMVLPLTASNHASLDLFGTGQYLDDQKPEFPDWTGFARLTLAAVPVVVVSPLMFFVYAISGAFHSWLYWAGFRIGGNSQTSEIIIGAIAWPIIVLTGWPHLLPSGVLP
jgi:hypothetical protein